VKSEINDDLDKSLERQYSSHFKNTKIEKLKNTNELGVEDRIKRKDSESRFKYISNDSQ